MLCQIEKAYRYAQDHRRICLVETEYEHSESFKDAFSNYFVPMRLDLIFNVSPFKSHFDQVDAFPSAVMGRINAYDCSNPNHPRYRDSLTGLPITFDFNLDYPQTLLVHHTAGGGDNSIQMLANMCLHERLVDRLIERLEAIGGPFIAFHIRNTDYRTRYRDSLKKIPVEPGTRVFVASDSLQAVNDVRKAFPGCPVSSFSTLPANDRLALHLHVVPGDDARQKNDDAILDLVTLALATRLSIFKISNVPWNGYAGFSRLAAHLQAKPGILARLIGRRHPLLDAFLGLRAPLR